MERVTTGNPRLDEILGGGLPRNSLTLVAGPPGTGKTILAQQFMFANASEEERGVYLTSLSEPRPKLLRYLQQLSFFDDEKLLGTPPAIYYGDVAQPIRAAGFEELPAVLTRVLREHRPSFLVVDSFKALRDLGVGHPRFREVLFDVAGHLSASACTTLLVGEYTPEEMAVLPEFAVVDGIIQLFNQKHGVRDERYLRVVKMRGSPHRTGEHAFRIEPSGLKVFPRLVTPREPPAYEASDERVSTGVAELDAMSGGGVWRGSTTLVAGPSGSGKTLLGLHFLFAGAAAREPGLLVSFQENPTQLRRIVGRQAWDPGEMGEGGLIHHLYVSPVEMNIDDIVSRIQDNIEGRGVRRLVIDSVGDLEAASWDKDRFRSYVYSMVQYFGARNVSAYLLLEAVISTNAGPLSESHISYLSDNVFGLRYLAEEDFTRGITVIKTRGSDHDPHTHPFAITSRGIVIDKARVRPQARRGGAGV